MTTGMHHLQGWWDADQQRHAVEQVRLIAAVAPFRRPSTPRGHAMRVQVTSAGAAGWWADHRGYRYLPAQPHTGRAQDGDPWPCMPQFFLTEAVRAAAECGVELEPDAALVNWYAPDASLSTHRDESEPDMTAAIVSFSLGAPAPFRLRGPERTDPVCETALLASGDCLVLAPPARSWYHEVPRLLTPDPLFSPLKSDGRLSILVRKVP